MWHPWTPNEELKLFIAPSDLIIYRQARFFFIITAKSLFRPLYTTFSDYIKPTHTYTINNLNLSLFTHFEIYEKHMVVSIPLWFHIQSMVHLQKEIYREIWFIERFKKRQFKKDFVQKRLKCVHWSEWFSQKGLWWLF